ncbi:MAG: polysaccharide deacetylase family protein [Candidatus Omnitrophica bacterium]|nr:polysaccharide deacetylase family protein [Candidatus Omnitrophota bacterium]MCF7876697.1 polysaccharide deacetylase family protein [Candidatus Omnitrophota bacterium]MCF7891820.1 polysaccharide deacetylase family protein [Candidatus Omnitrophota bacterium]MCF7895582.1 polysaccharide deacetylase family protein [Candidatus Omnitrophota bacterium]MCF7897198.1 polysaccharide deacetylase family protein [Candidatus Omnitrophota bacterium]
MINSIISVDLEDWDTSAYLRNYLSKNNNCPKIVDSTYPILDLFARKKVKATFFVLGIIAEKYPDLIKEIFNHGHEIASHGYSHNPLWGLNKEKFRKEIKKTNAIIENIIKNKPRGFRAPYASLDKKTFWAIDVLKEEGFRYDSSIFPMLTPLYGAPAAPVAPYKISSENIYTNDPESGLLEVPFTVFNFGLFKIPCTGGFYGRVIPLFLLKYLFKRVSRDRYVNFYFHPWETLPSIPRVKAPLFNKFVSYFNVDNYLDKIEQLLDCLKGVSFKDYSELEAGKVFG